MAEAFKMTGDPVEPAQLDSLMDAYIAHYSAHIADDSRSYPASWRRWTPYARRRADGRADQQTA